MTATDKIIMIKKECSRNPVKTIVLEVSIGAMRRPVKNNAADGNFHMFNRLDTFSEKADYLLKHTPFDNWAYIYARSMITSAYSILDGSFKNNKDDENKGYVPDPVNDLTLENDKIAEEYGSKPFSLNDYYESSIQEFEDTIDYCKSLGVRLIVAVVPVSDGYLWKIKNADEFGNWINEFCKKKNVECYNFNLAKNRYELFNDSESYGASEDHMSHVGAENFTRLFVQTINQIDSGTNASDLFYGSYSDMIKDSPYMKYYKNSEGKK